MIAALRYFEKALEPERLLALWYARRDKGLCIACAEPLNGAKWRCKPCANMVPEKRAKPERKYKFCIECREPNDRKASAKWCKACKRATVAQGRKAKRTNYE